PRWGAPPQQPFLQICHPAGVRLRSNPFLQICHPAGVDNFFTSSSVVGMNLAKRSVHCRSSSRMVAKIGGNLRRNFLKPYWCDTMTNRTYPDQEEDKKHE